MNQRSISKRELEILKLISKEYTIKEIGEALFISPLTVASHRKNMMTKLRVKNMAGLVRAGFQKGILK